MINNEILKYLQIIPVWKVSTYKILAKKFSLHPRTIASILKKNTNQDIYPCYKVVMSDGKIGWYNLWIEEKIKRLAKENIIIENWKIDKKYFFND